MNNNNGASKKPTNVMTAISGICLIALIIYAVIGSSAGVLTGVVWLSLAIGGFLVFGIMAIVFAAQNKKANK
jgi:hypothetical protein